MFPDLTADQVLDATRTRWDLTGPVPTPKPGWLACPVCSCDVVQPRWWRFHQRTGSPTVPWRCDVSFKCTSCAHVWVHGLVLDADAWARRADARTTGRHITWRRARQLLEQGD